MAEKGHGKGQKKPNGITKKVGGAKRGKVGFEYIQNGKNALLTKSAKGRWREKDKRGNGKRKIDKRGGQGRWKALKRVGSWKIDGMGGKVQEGG